MLFGRPPHVRYDDPSQSAARRHVSESAEQMDESYFSRCATWHWLSPKQVAVNDSFTDRAPRLITMEPWHQVVFLAADGEHTVGEFVQAMGRQYPKPPAGLREQIHDLVRVLVGEGIVRLHPRSVPLPPYFAEDYFAETPETRAAQMRRDGLIP